MTSDFHLGDGSWTGSGFANVVNTGLACHSGQEIRLNLTTLEFAVSSSWLGLYFYFGEYEGNLNLEVSGDFLNFDNFDDIQSMTIGGAQASVGGDGDVVLVWFA